MFPAADFVVILWIFFSSDLHRLTGYPAQLNCTFLIYRFICFFSFSTWLKRFTKHDESDASRDHVRVNLRNEGKSNYILETRKLRPIAPNSVTSFGFLLINFQHCKKC